MQSAQAQIEVARIRHVARLAPLAFIVLVVVGFVNWFVFNSFGRLAANLNAGLLIGFLSFAAARYCLIQKVSPQNEIDLNLIKRDKALYLLSTLGVGLMWAGWIYQLNQLPIEAQATLFCALVATLFVAVGSSCVYPVLHCALAAPPLTTGLVILLTRDDTLGLVTAMLLVSMYATLTYMLVVQKRAVVSSIRDRIRADAIDIQQQRILDSGRNAIIVATRKNLLTMTEPAAQLLGVGEDGVLLDLRIGLGAKQVTWDRLWNRVESQLQRAGLLSATIRFTRPDGQKIWVEIQARLLDPVSPELGVLWQLADATKRRELEERNLYLATHDPLTGCWNRTAIEQNLRTLTAQPVGERSTAGFSLLCLDLDGFKQINDQHGHAVGDAVLKIVRQRLENILRPSDKVGRLGGDEFIVLLPETPLREQAALVSDKLVDAISQPINVNQQVVSVGVSIGLAIWPTDSLDPEALMRIADVNMYTSKQAGRNAYRRALTGFI